MSLPIHFSDEMKLMGYGESDSSGAWIKCQILPEDLDKFRGLKGQRFAVTMVMIGDDEKPTKAAEKKKDRNVHLRLTAIELCENNDFHVYLAQTKTDMVGCQQEDAILWLRDECGIKSRSELDRNTGAAGAFARIRQDFMEWKANGRRGNF